MRKIFNTIKIGLIVLLILINIVVYHFLPVKVTKQFITMLVSLLNVKVTIHGNTDGLKSDNLLLMANHYDGVIDSGVLFDLYYKHNKENILYTVVKHNIVGDPTDKSSISKLLCYIKSYFIRSLYFIPYKRGDKEDGVIVKNKIVETLETGKNILIFPEGTTHKDGVSKDFRHGIFKLAVEKKMNILPITLKYSKDIGAERFDPVDFYKLFDNKLDIYIHDLIDSNLEEYYQTKDYLGLKEKVFRTIGGGAAPSPPAGG
jgi:1-acyl-sn-glycerol-3-phosphate acyltransferase